MTSRNRQREFYRKTTLDNGLRIVTSRMNHVHSASISFLFGSGARDEADDQAGIAHFMEHMLFKGTPRRPDPVMITMQIEEVGGIINAATGRESTNYWAKVPAAHLDRAFDVLADVVRHSTFPEHELEKSGSSSSRRSAGSTIRPTTWSTTSSTNWSGTASRSAGRSSARS
ncbi:MAG: insulinase family protein [Thermomicrobiales bacterium]